MRGLIAGLAWACTVAVTPVLAQEITSARYIEPTDAYGHGAVAQGEYAALEVTFSDGTRRTVRWGDAVFEDTAPRLHDFDGDGGAEVITVVSDFNRGARVQLFKANGRRAFPRRANAPIGSRNRWLAIAGIADFDGDGVEEIAYVDRPHLAKELVLLSVDVTTPAFTLSEMARVRGLTNHHLGSAVIEGGVRHCAGTAPVVLTADGDWSHIMETQVSGGVLVSTPVARYEGASGFAPYLRCP